MALDINELKRIVPDLLQQAPGPSEEEPTQGATLEEIGKFETENQVSLSQDVVEWLTTANGIMRGPGAFTVVSGPMAWVPRSHFRTTLSGKQRIGFRYQTMDAGIILSVIPLRNAWEFDRYVLLMRRPIPTA